MPRLDDQRTCITRPEVGEGFDPIASMFRRFELIYVVGAERFSVNPAASAAAPSEGYGGCGGDQGRSGSPARRPLRDEPWRPWALAS